MKNSKAFTLMELLVVISIIALLLAILMPSLNKAKELARRIVCTNHLKTLTSASATYAAAQNGYFVPAGYSPYYDPALPNGGTPSEQSCMWLVNETYRRYIDIDAHRAPGAGVLDTPDDYLCPSDKITINPAYDTGSSAPTSYGYNITDWANVPWNDMWPGKIVGHKVDSIKQPAGKLHFIDAIDWWCGWSGARYKAKWDVVGQAPVWDYAPIAGKTPPQPHVYGAVFFRHNEGAVIGFYDAHAEYMRKEKIFDYDAYTSTTSPKWCDMWTSSGTIPPGYGTPYP
jgi:prepilin-type N-terminal cleavage/methylation domain-containing protein